MAPQTGIQNPRAVAELAERYTEPRRSSDRSKVAGSGRCRERELAADRFFDLIFRPIVVSGEIGDRLARLVAVRDHEGGNTRPGERRPSDHRGRRRRSSRGRRPSPRRSAVGPDQEDRRLGGERGEDRRLERAPPGDAESAKDGPGSGCGWCFGHGRLLTSRRHPEARGLRAGHFVAPSGHSRPPGPHLPNPERRSRHRVRKGTLGCPPRLPGPPRSRRPSPDVDRDSSSCSSLSRSRFRRKTAPHDPSKSGYRENDSCSPAAIRVDRRLFVAAVDLRGRGAAAYCPRRERAAGAGLASGIGGRR
jgi:hypothetical protein